MKMEKKLILSLFAALICVPNPCKASYWSELLWEHKGKIFGLATLAVGVIGQETWFAWKNRQKPQAEPKKPSIFTQILSYMPQRVLDQQLIAEVSREQSNSEILKRLVEKKANINTYDPKERPLLLVALQEQPINNALPVTLLKMNADPNLVEAKRDSGLTPLMQAVKNNQHQNFDLINALLESHAQHEAKDFHGRNALFYALERYNLPLVARFIDTAADIFKSSNPEEEPVERLDAFAVMAASYQEQKNKFQNLNEFKDLATNIMYLLLGHNLKVGFEPANGTQTSFDLFAQAATSEDQGFQIAKDLLHILQVNTQIMNTFFETVQMDEEGYFEWKFPNIRSKLLNVQQVTEMRIAYITERTLNTETKSLNKLISKTDHKEQYAYLDSVIPQDERLTSLVGEAPKKTIDLGDLVITLSRVENETIEFKIMVKNGELQ